MFFEDAVGANTVQMLYHSENVAEQFFVVALTPNTFRFLGVPALIGRSFGEDDARPGAPRVTVLSHKAWINYFGGDAGILGRTILLNNTPMTVIGVMPPRFTWNTGDVWIPDAADRGDPDGMNKAFWLQARLKKGISLPQAAAELDVIARRLARTTPTAILRASRSPSSRSSTGSWGNSEWFCTRCSALSDCCC